jgi:hypothetical protein
MKAQHQLEILYFQVDEGIVCMDIVSTFRILIIIYQSFSKSILENLNNQPIQKIFFIHFSYIEISQTLCTTYNKLNEVRYDFKIKFK